MPNAPYIVRNDITGRAWPAHASEALMYASYELSSHYSVFRTHGNGLPLNSFDIFIDQPHHKEST